MTNVDTLIGHRLGSLYVEDDDLMGIDSTLKELIRSLVEGPSTRAVISISDEDGIGKTILVKKAYDDDAVKRHFDCYIWIIVTQSHNIEKVLKMLKRKICSNKEQTMIRANTIEELIDF